MDIYMIEDAYRVDGITGRFVEEALDANLPRYGEEICLTSARNQYVSFQVVLDAREEGIVREARIALSPFRGKRGELAAEAELFVEWFHTVKGTAGQSCRES